MSDVLDAVIEQELDPEQIAIRGHLDRLGLQEHELDVFAHMSSEILSKLSYARVIGNPKTWMQENLNRTTPLEMEEYHSDLIDILVKIEEEIDAGAATELIGNMIRLANEGNPDDREDRREYQINEKYLMDLVIGAIEERVNEIPADQTLQWTALRGAKFFQSDFADFAQAGTVEVETKRIKLRNEQFAVGMGNPSGLENVNIPNVKQIILPDDCLSTGMSQEENIRMILNLGFRPERIVVPVTVATTGGFNKLKDLEEEIREIYKREGIEYDFELLVACAVVCESVNEQMYLQTIDGLKLVGDMGEWNKDINGDL
jgi:hypothetical protein